ncbi:hypothetical protein GYMLUDRAFT_251454 [Collybiopsis luxurians FD-317 M1]|uniref:Uncharacterized protein n=1 Tax=Collybiopsis luxurians FD-317 M1 TaxID=944289 RepID=A0A0D0BRE6_9AGAR|nr:hypothetical protein GYMLUDRAFT_251454 [Collybiopsis luxurians FD-317 M1]
MKPENPQNEPESEHNVVVIDWFDLEEQETVVVDDDPPCYQTKDLFSQLQAQLQGCNHFTHPGNYIDIANDSDSDQFYVTIVNHLNGRKALFKTKDEQRLDALIASTCTAFNINPSCVKLLKVTTNPQKLKWEFYNLSYEKTVGQARIYDDSVLRLIHIDH